MTQVIVFKWRRVPESNRCTRICNPLRHHSANSPLVTVVWRVVSCHMVWGPSINVPFCSQEAKRQLFRKIAIQKITHFGVFCFGIASYWSGQFPAEQPHLI